MKEEARFVASMPPATTDAARRAEPRSDVLVRWARWAVGRLRTGLPRDQREDVVQSTLARVIEIERRTGQIHSQEYILRTVHSVIVDELRRGARTMAQPQGTGDPPGVLQEVPEELRDLAPTVDSCLESLSPDRRRIVFLHLQGFGSREIAALLRLDRKHVRNHTFRGMSELRSLLRRKGFG